ncbi:hypothetical protein ES703_50569 [subsurface metagenome]
MVMNAQLDRIEILPVSLLDSQHTTVEEIRWISKALDRGLGWHYLLDLSWAAQVLQPKPGQHMMDAGAGTGIMQWWLAAIGYAIWGERHSTIFRGSNLSSFGFHYGKAYVVTYLYQRKS